MNAPVVNPSQSYAPDTDVPPRLSAVWFVVIDDAVYLRLGPRAARRIDTNSTAPLLKLRVLGREVHTVRYEKAPEMAETIAAAMAAKYWTDFLGEPFRKLGLSAPPVMPRLVPEGGASAAAVARQYSGRR